MRCDVQSSLLLRVSLIIFMAADKHLEYQLQYLIYRETDAECLDLLEKGILLLPQKKNKHFASFDFIDTYIFAIRNNETIAGFYQA